MNFDECKFVNNLHLAENRFLEPLITEFMIERIANNDPLLHKGARLIVEFDETTPSVWNSIGKGEVMERIPDFADKAAEYRKGLDNFLLNGEGDHYSFSDANFPFRYASGGALPVLWIGSNEYYCLFYREIFPIGWNIANGGCDSRVELLSPLDTIERELREELIIVDPVNKKKRYVFKADVGRSLERPEFVIARKFWQQRHPEWNLDDLDEVVLPTKWLRGPDSLTVKLSSVNLDFTTDGCFLNINAPDFGIEIDRVVGLTVDPDALLLDGEIITGYVKDTHTISTTIVNSPIGLFRSERLNEDFRTGSTDFRPDVLFWNGERQQPDQLEEVIKRYFEEIKPWLNEGEIAKFQASQERFNLCPVTRSLVNRCLTTWFEEDKPIPPPGQNVETSIKDLPFEVFISFAGEDLPFARQVYEYLNQKALETHRGRPFFSEQTLQDFRYGRAINAALSSANFLVAIATKAEHLNKKFVEYEWSAFHNSIICERKPENAQLITFVKNVRPIDLPFALADGQMIDCQNIEMAQALEKLYEFVRISLNM